VVSGGFCVSLRKPFFPVVLLVAALTSSAATAATQKVDKDGISVEFLQPESVVEGQDALLRFSVRAADGTPLTGVRPAAWIDAKSADAKGATACRDKIQSFLGGTLRARPQVDLNTYYILTLNVEASLAVIDPLLGFGGSKLLTAITLQSPGVDWALSRDQKRVFVAMPLVNRVAVIDTETWEVVKNIDVGMKPARLALRDSLWVLSDSTVSVIDPLKLEVVKAIEAGKGPHHIAFDAKNAYVSGAEKVTVVDPAFNVRSVPGAAAALAYSSLSNSVYAIDEASGVISIVDSKTRIQAKPGINSIQFAPGGRWGFITNAKDNAVHVLDASTAKIVTTATDVGAGPDQIAFTEEFAYVRALGSDHVKLIRLASLATDPQVSMATFPAGQLPPSAAKAESFAAAIVPAPEPKAVLVANPADRTVYYYMEGMAAPMGNFVAKGRTPKAVLVLDRSLKESEPSVFSIRTKVPAAGQYDVAFFMNDPRVVHCFDLTVAADPNAPAKAVQRTVKIEPLMEQKSIRAGQEVEVKFRLSDTATSELRGDARDVRALAFLAPGTWQQRIAAQPAADGLYSVKLTVPEPGIYYVFLESPSLNLRMNKTRPVIFEATP
jgi:DNA-binding beta-propeller fold protein YncE